jgi:hypothetical protein
LNGSGLARCRRLKAQDPPRPAVDTKVPVHMRRVLALGSLCGLLALLAVPPVPAAAAGGVWLDRLNAWRASVNLPALAENTTWSQGDYSHSLYMVKNDQVTHYELSTLPYYTVAGDTAARNGNIEVNSTTSFSDDRAIDWWMAAPFHALGMMDPRLTTTGFGAYREVKSGWQAGFTLDTLRGNSFTGGTYPVFFPGDRSSVPLRSYGGNEFPDPLQACPGYSAPTGLPVFVEVGGNVATTVGAHAFTANGTPLANCVIDSSSAAVGSSLKARGAVILIPQQPLQPGVTYAVTMTVNGVPYAWSFGVTSDNSIVAPIACPVTATIPTVETTTEFTFSFSASCVVSQFDIEAFDVTLNQGWIGIGAVSASSSSGSIPVDGFPGHTYQLRVRSRSASGLVSGWTTVTTQISATATKSHPFSGVYTLDGYGGVHGADSPPLGQTAYWAGWNIARIAKAWPGASAPQSGFVLDGWGGLHPYGAPGLAETSGGSSHYWPGWDIARDFAFLPDGTGGVVLDGWGGLHAFRVNGNTSALAIQQTGYWPGWDIARKVVIFADGSGGYVMDGWGGLHPFGINGAPPVAESQLAATGYWPGWSIARDVVLTPLNGGHSGYVLDGWGGLHPFHATTDGSTMPASISSAYWPGWDIARGVWLLPGSASAGYTLDGWGGPHPFGGAPAIQVYTYWPGSDLAKGVWGA